MLSLNDISAWIEVDGKELEQYGIEEDVGHSQVTCWIPTQAGKVAKQGPCHIPNLQQTSSVFPSYSGTMRHTGITRCALLSSLMGRPSKAKSFSPQPWLGTLRT